MEPVKFFEADVTNEMQLYFAKQEPMRSQLTIVPGPGAFVFVTSTPMPNAWFRFWQWFFLGWTWKEV